MSQIHNRCAGVHGQRLFCREAGQREQTPETEQAARSALTLEARPDRSTSPASPTSR
jgi:hypothetical protein